MSYLKTTDGTGWSWVRTVPTPNPDETGVVLGFTIVSVDGSLTGLQFTTLTRLHTVEDRKQCGPPPRFEATGRVLLRR